MSRSKYKFLMNSRDKSLFNLKKYSRDLINSASKSKPIPDFVAWGPNFLLFPSLLNKKLAIYSGKNFSVFQIKPSMFWLKSGHLVRTKRLGSLIHILKKKKRRK